MSFSEITMWIMAILALVGGIDRIIGNKLGLGEKFEEGLIDKSTSLTSGR